MKRNIPAISLLLIVLIGLAYGVRQLDNGNEIAGSINKSIESAVNTGLKEGDLIFQTSLSGQSKAIQLATHSKYSHCGLIFKDGNKYYVLEAIQPVKRTPLDEWIARGKNGEYVVKRLRNADAVLTPTIVAKMKSIGQELLGKNYDLTFEWSDEKIYCSELIWKVYQRATGLELGRLQKLSEFDLSDPKVKEKMMQRYGTDIPENEIVISPASIFDSQLLRVVETNQ